MHHCFVMRKLRGSYCIHTPVGKTDSLTSALLPTQDVTCPASWSGWTSIKSCLLQGETSDFVLGIVSERKFARIMPWSEFVVQRAGLKCLPILV
jgi:hypothetical protein